MIKKALTILLVLVVVGVLARDAIAGALLTGGIRAITGLSAKVERVHVGLLGTLVRVQGLTVLNPAGFTDRVLLEVPELFVNYDPVGFATGKVHLEEVRLHVAELSVIRERAGALNLDALKVVKESKGRAPAATPPSKRPSPLLIDRLELHLGRVTYKDYSRGTPPHTQTVGLNIHERYEHITDPQTLASLILVRALANTAIARLTNLDFASLKWQAGDTLSRARAVATEALGAATNAGQQVGGRAIDAAGETVDKATNAIKQLFQ